MPLSNERIESERVKFEAQVRDEYPATYAYSLRRDEDGEYGGWIFHAWEGWLACAGARAEEDARKDAVIAVAKQLADVLGDGAEEDRCLVMLVQSLIELESLAAKISEP